MEPRPLSNEFNYTLLIFPRMQKAHIATLIANICILAYIISTLIFWSLVILTLIRMPYIFVLQVFGNGDEMRELGSGLDEEVVCVASGKDFTIMCNTAGRVRHAAHEIKSKISSTPEYKIKTLKFLYIHILFTFL